MDSSIYIEEFDISINGTVQYFDISIGSISRNIESFDISTFDTLKLSVFIMSTYRSSIYRYIEKFVISIFHTSIYRNFRCIDISKFGGNFDCSILYFEISKKTMRYPTLVYCSTSSFYVPYLPWTRPWLGWRNPPRHSVGLPPCPPWWSPFFFSRSSVHHFDLRRRRPSFCRLRSVASPLCALGGKFATVAADR